MREPAQLNLFPSSLRLTRIDPVRNMRRFYNLQLQPNLFGGCTLVREWGRIGSGGRVRQEAFEHEAHAMNALLAFERAKRRRGYCTA